MKILTTNANVVGSESVHRHQRLVPRPATGFAPKVPEVERLRGALIGGEAVFSTGLVLQELLQGCQGRGANHPPVPSNSIAVP